MTQSEQTNTTAIRRALALGVILAACANLMLDLVPFTDARNEWEAILILMLAGATPMLTVFVTLEENPFEGFVSGIFWTIFSLGFGAPILGAILSELIRWA